MEGEDDCLMIVVAAVAVRVDFTVYGIARIVASKEVLTRFVLRSRRVDNIVANVLLVFSFVHESFLM